MRGAGGLEAVEIERPVQPHVDQAGDAALDVIGARGFLDIDARQQFGRYVLQRDEAAGGGENLAAVQQGRDVGQAADQQLLASAALRLICTPVTCCSASMTLLSGNLPMSSATIESHEFCVGTS